MNKSEAAEYLGISTRQVTNYARQGKLSVHYEKGKTGDVATFDERELRKLKAELDRKRTPRPGVSHATDTPSSEGSETLPALASRPSNLPALQNLFAALLSGKATPAPTAPGEKILLDLKDCRALTGLSDGLLRVAIHSGKLKGKIIGKAYRVKRADLDAYIKKL